MGRGTQKTGTLSSVLLSLLRWFDSYAGMEELRRCEEKKVDWWRVFPLLFLHAMCAGVLRVGWHGLVILSWLGIVRNLRTVSGEVLGENLLDAAIRDA